jgi:GT2 family glycosyltransferase
MLDLSKLSIGIRTFLRDGKLFKTIRDIRNTMPDAKMIIADCGYLAGGDVEHGFWISYEKQVLYAELEQRGHKVIQMNFDAGLGAMSNAIVNALDTPYLLISSDDFDHGDPQYRVGIEKMLAVLEKHPRYYAVSGRVDNKPYEMFLSDKGDIVAEHNARIDERVKESSFLEVFDVDLTVNYTIFRRETFKEIRWDEPEPKIGGGEHGAFFVDMRRAGFKVGFVPGVNINQQEGADSAEYRNFRNRARSPERPCFVKRGIKQYILANGIVDYKEKK